MDFLGPLSRRQSCKPDARLVVGKIASMAAPNINNPVMREICHEVSQQLLSEVDFYSRLTQMVPKPGKGMQPSKRFRDSEFEQISTLLKLRGKWKWALRPRHYVVCYMTGMEHVMDEIVKENRSDIFLPYRRDNLPNALKGMERDMFLQCQDNVLTGQGAILERGGGAHQHYPGSADALFIYNGPLGTGMTGVLQSQVDYVIGLRSLGHFALKKIGRAAFSNDDARSIHLFTNELEILKSLSHHHIVKLVGSYTDRDCVGLLMWPVADKNLAQFLKEDLDPRDQQARKMKIRTFFGCIAMALDYLHNNETKRVRHKDIKPGNILVKDNKVYVADFGTSHAWTGDAGGMTEGTQQFFTRKYLAPEAFGERDTPSDIWSLGCVFLEMCTVLADLPFNAIAEFFATHGTRKSDYNMNTEAMNEWMHKLKEVLGASEVPHDVRILELVEDMCEIDPKRRLEAHDLVRRIFEIDSVPSYHGLCCSKQRWLRGSHDTPYDQPRAAYIVDETDDEKTISAEDYFVSEPEHSRYLGFPENYQQPSVEEGEITLQLMYNEAPREARNILEDVTQPIEISSQAEVASVDCSDVPSNVVKDSAASEEQKVSVTSEPALIERLKLLPKMSVPLCQKPPPKRPHYIRPIFDDNRLPCPWPHCRPPRGLAVLLFDSTTALRRHLRHQHLVHDFAWSYLLDECGNKTKPSGSLTPEQGAFVHMSRRDRPRSRSSGAKRDKNVRFSEPKGERKEPRTSPQTHPRTEHRLVPRKARYTINAEPLEEMSVDGVSEAAAGNMSRTSLCPSYLLASRNRFSISELFDKRYEKPVFVYGSLMFPSILKSRSANFVSQREGIYSSVKGRRLRTNAVDWNHISSHLQNAAEAMTPARLAGYHRLRLSGSRLAFLEQSTDANEHTSGFLIFGLATEARACLEHLYEKGGPRSLFYGGSDTHKWDETQMQLVDVTVEINSSDGSIVPMDATTFVMNSANMGFREKKRLPWNINSFLRSRTFNSLSNNLEHGEAIKEEQEIAEKLGTTLVLPGDKLATAALNNDANGVQELLNDGFDIDSASPEYGSALQAAASRGHINMMQILIDEGADLQARGGEYGCPLIAAVVKSQLSAVKLLLRHNVNVFTPGGRYISAIYQAVDFGNLDIAHCLLEKGAWLTDNYAELLDLAAEHGDEDMRRELEVYDVRGFHIDRNGVRPPRRTDASKDTRRISEKSSSSSSSSRSQRSAPHSERTYSRTMTVSRQAISSGGILLFEAVKLQGEDGKWTGTKGVKLMKLALDNGFNEKIMLQIRPHVHSWSTIQQFFTRMVGDSLGGRLRPVQHTNLLHISGHDDLPEDDTVRRASSREARKRRDSIVGRLEDD